MAKKKASKQASQHAGDSPPAKPASAKATGDSGDFAGPVVGEPAPGFEATDQDGKTHRLSDYLGRWVVLYFYPRDLTPGCTTQACEFRDALGELGDRGAVVLGVSTDDGPSHRRFRGKHGLPFDLLADVGHAVCEAYGVWREKSMYGRKSMGVVRTTFLIDPRGRVAQRWDKVKPAGHAGEVLQALQAARA